MTQTNTMTIGFVGLGNLGEPLCNSLVGKAFKVTVTDLNQASATRLLQAGAQWSMGDRGGGGDNAALFQRHLDIAHSPKRKIHS